MDALSLAYLAALALAALLCARGAHACLRGRDIAGGAVTGGVGVGAFAVALTLQALPAGAALDPRAQTASLQRQQPADRIVDLDHDATSGSTRRLTARARTVLRQIAACESAGAPGAVSATGRYRGKYQFDPQTWASVGGTGDPALAGEAEQDHRAALLLRARGTQPWPVCGRARGSSELDRESAMHPALLLGPR